jgi:hypothetical protein
MKQRIIGGLAAGLMTGTVMTAALIASAPPASAGCQPWEPTGQLCDEPIQPDGTWQRCIVDRLILLGGTKSTCYPLGDNHVLPISQPPGHIDP